MASLGGAGGSVAVVVGAGELGSATQLEGSQALASQVTGWLLATQARLGLTGEACAASPRADWAGVRAFSVAPAVTQRSVDRRPQCLSNRL
jgi:hypothetical protein